MIHNKTLYMHLIKEQVYFIVVTHLEYVVNLYEIGTCDIIYDFFCAIFLKRTATRTGDVCGSLVL